MPGFDLRGLPLAEARRRLAAEGYRYYRDGSSHEHEDECAYAHLIVLPEKWYAPVDTGTHKDYGYSVSFLFDEDYLASEIHSACECGPGYNSIGVYRRDEKGGWAWCADRLPEGYRTEVTAGDAPG